MGRSKQQNGKKGKRQREHKVSRGVHGSTKTRLTTLEKVLLGKGVYASPRLFGSQR